MNRPLDLDPSRLAARADRGQAGDSASERAVRSLSVMTAGRVGTQIVLVASALAIPHLLGTETFGRYATVMSLVAILEVVGSGGLHLAEVRYFAPAWRADPDRAAGIGSSLWTTRLALSVLVSFVAAGWLVASPAAAGDARFIVATALLVGLRSALEATRQLFLSLGRVATMVTFELLRSLALLGVVAVASRTLDLAGIVVALCAVQAVLVVAAVGMLRRAAPIRIAVAWSTIGPMLRFGAATLLGMVAWIVQAQLPVFAVGNWGSLHQAAVVGMTVQVYVLGQTMLLSPWNAVMPILAELDATGQRRRLAEWGSIMMRWSAAAAVLVTMAWAFLGQTLLAALPSSFAEVHVTGALMLVGVALLSSTVATNGILYASGSPGWGSASQVLFAAITVAGAAAAIALDVERLAYALGWVYLVAAAAFATLAHLCLRHRTGIRLPIGAAVLLVAPLLCAWPVVEWHAPLVLRGLGLAAFAAGYLGGAAMLGLLPVREITPIIASVAGRARSRRADARQLRLSLQLPDPPAANRSAS